MSSAKDIKPAGGPARPRCPPPSPEGASRRAEELQTGPCELQAPVNTQHPPSRPGGPGCRRRLGSDSAFWDRPGLERQRENRREPRGARVREGLGLAFHPLTLIRNANTVQLPLQPAARDTLCPLLSLPLYSSLQLREDLEMGWAVPTGALGELKEVLSSIDNEGPGS